VRRSRRKGALEKVQLLLLRAPYRCRDCNHRFVTAWDGQREQEQSRKIRSGRLLVAVVLVVSCLVALAASQWIYLIGSRGGASLQDSFSK